MKINLRKVAKSLYLFLIAPDEVQSDSFDNCIHHYNIKIFNLFDPELQLSKELLNELKMFKVQAVLVLNYKKINDSQIFHSYTKIIASNLYTDKVFKFVHESQK